PILGQMSSNTTFSADTLQTSTLRFTGKGVQIYGTTNFTGPGRWINDGIVHGGGGYLNLNQSLTNTGTLYLQGYTNIATGDTLYNDGHIILVMDNYGRLSQNGSGTPLPVILNRGVIQGDNQLGDHYVSVPIINQDTVRIDAGRLVVTTSFDNQSNGVISGINGIFDEINNRPYLSNEGGIYPYGPYSRLTISGPLDLSSPTSYIKIDIGGDQLNGKLRITNTFTSGQGVIKVRASGSYIPQDYSAYNVLSAMQGLPTTLPSVSSDIQYVHFTEAAVQDSILQLTAHRDLASIGKISRDTINAGLIAPLTIKGSGFNSQSHFWISEHLPSKPDSVVTEDLMTDSLFSDHVNVSIDLREPWWMGRGYIHTQNPGQPADSTSIFIIPVLSVHFKRFVGRQGVGIINGDPYNGRSWTTTHFYGFSSYPVRQFIVGEFIKPHFSFVQSAISSQYHGRGTEVWDSYSSPHHDHTLLVSGVYPGLYTNFYSSTTISTSHVLFTPSGLANLSQALADTSMFPYSAYAASHYIFWVIPDGQYQLVMQRCIRDSANAPLSNFLSTLAPSDSLLNATIDDVLSSGLTRRFSQPDLYLKQILINLVTLMHSTADAQSVYEQSLSRFTAMWAYQVNMLIYHSVKEHLGADNQPSDSSAHQAINIAAQNLYNNVKKGGNRNISNSLPSNNSSDWFQFPYPPSQPTEPPPPDNTNNNYPHVEPGGFAPKPGPDICVSNCSNTPGNDNKDSFGNPIGPNGTTVIPDTCNPSDLTLKGQIACVKLVPLVAPFDPNDKSALSSGPAKVDSSNGTIHVRHYYIPLSHAQDSLRYSIHFENLAAATGAAHTVTITDTLDSNVDPASFHLMNASHDSVLTVQQAGHIVTFTFNGIDLPPDTAAPGGEGFVSYAVKPNTGLTNGTMIKNQASIVFDSNPAILTPTTVHVITKTADATLALQSMTDSLVVGKKDTLSISITNNGPDPADSVHVLMLVPGSIAVQSVMGDSSWTQKHDSLMIRMGSVAATKTATAKLAIVSHVTGSTSFAAQVYTSSADADIFNDQALLTVKSVQGTPIEVSNSNLPARYSLHQNYPNPFNPTTTISFALPKAGKVRLEIYNILGQKVATLINKSMRAGYYNVQWDARQVASGLYLYRITSGHFVKTKKMMLIK
ncbi:MAG TPA: T9SS type A sorting domain-containing protein, partial [Balneolales bacterium]|nr:T9SS type A sorting domain-containing protein [Balneolales bacterium]